jgi:chromosome segregation ATPase
MWDKKHNFPLKPSSGPMPPGVGLEDEELVDDDFSSPQPGNISTSCSRSDKRNQTSAGKDISSAIKQLTNVHHKSTSELIKALVNGEASTEKSTSHKQYELVGRISGIRKEIKESDNDINDLKMKRNRIEEKYKDYPDKKQKKLKKINDEIKQQETVRATLKTTMMQYTKQLSSLKGEQSDGGKNSDSSKSSISDDSN